jgi:hypothetical protein
MKYEVQAYADRISTMNLQPDELESFELVKTMSADFRVEDATARELDGPTASVFKARAAQLAPTTAPAPRPEPAPTSLPASVPAATPPAARKKAPATPQPGSPTNLDEVVAKFEALFLELLRARAGKGDQE